MIIANPLARLLPCLALLYSLAVMPARPDVSADEPRTGIFPGATWIQKTPEAAGFQPDILKAVIKGIGGSGCLVHRGYLVAIWGKAHEAADIASAAKPVYTHLVLATLEQGLISSLDEPVEAHWPELRALRLAAEPVPRPITWRDLLQQVSGYGTPDPPGVFFNYNDHAVALLLDALLKGVHGAPYRETDARLLRPLLAEPLQFEDAATLYHRNSRPGRLRVSARDLARFGLLYRHHGRWQNRQVVPSKSAKLVTSSPLPPDTPRSPGQPAPMLPRQRTVGDCFNAGEPLGSFSYFWWLNGQAADGSRLLPDAPADTFVAAGHGGRTALVVIPSRDLVATWISGLPGMTARHYNMGGSVVVNLAIKHLLTAAPDADEPGEHHRLGVTPPAGP
jgi:CubicO group peptidase (beta-lactamase class C family)